MISENTNRLIVPLLLSLSKSLRDAGVVFRKNHIIHFGTTVPVIKHQLIVKANVINRVIIRPFASNN